MTFSIPVSSSRLRNTTPRAVGGCCRWVTRPATATAESAAVSISGDRADDAVSTRRAASSARMWATGCVP